MQKKNNTTAKRKKTNYLPFALLKYIIYIHIYVLMYYIERQMIPIIYKTPIVFHIYVYINIDHFILVEQEHEYIIHILYILYIACFNTIFIKKRKNTKEGQNCCLMRGLSLDQCLSFFSFYLFFPTVST